MSTKTTHRNGGYPTPDQLRAQSAARLAEARRHVDNGGPAYERALSEAKELAGTALMADIDDALARGRARFEGWSPIAKDDNGFSYDKLAWRELKSAGATLRYHVPLAVDAKDYAAAFMAYLAKGNPALLGPNDRKVLAEGTDTAGGFAVPADFQERVIQKLAASVAVYRLATKIPTSRSLVSIPRVNYGDDDLFTSPVRLTWTGEQPASATTAAATDPVLGLVNVPVHTAMASLIASADLLEDGGMEILATRLFGEAFAMGEASAYVGGDGSGKPKGILSDVDGDGPASVASGTSGEIATAADAHSGRRLLDLRKAVPAQYWQDSAWLMNADTEEEAENLVDTQERPLLSLEGVNVPEGAVGMIKNRPVYVDQFVPDSDADDYPIIFGDLSGYLIAERVGLSVQVITDVTFARTNTRVLLARRRVGGYLAEPYRVKVLKAAA